MTNERNSKPVAACIHATAIACSVVLAAATLFQPCARGQTVGCAPYTANYPCVYVANESDDTVSVINAATKTVIATVDITGGSGAAAEPGAVAITPDNAYVYVGNTNFNQGSVTLIATDTNTLGPTVALQSPELPGGIAITPDGKQAWVTEPGGYYSYIGFVGIDIIDTTVDPSKNLPAITATITTLSDAAATPLKDPTAIAFTPDGTVAYVADTCSDPQNTGATIACADKVSVASHTVIKQIPIEGTVAFHAASIVVTPDGSRACMSTLTSSTSTSSTSNLVVACISTADDTVSTIPLPPLSPPPPVTPFLSPSNYGFGVTPAGVLYAATYSDSTSGNQVFLFDPSHNSFIGSTTVGSGPTGVAVSADGTSVYVTNCCNNSDQTATDTVSIIDTGTGAITTTLNVGFDPQGVAAMPSIPATITSEPIGQTIDYGQSATLSVTVEGTAPFSYQWYALNGTSPSPIQGATSSTYTTPPLTATTTYAVMVANRVAGASVRSKNATITVNPYVPPTITTQPVSQPVTSGQPATLTVAATGTPPLAYQWYQGQSGDTSTPIPGATGSSYTTPVLTATTSYWVLVSSLVQGQSATAQSSTATITVNFVPTCTLSLQGTETSTFMTQFTVRAIANCTDPQNSPLTTSIDWKDGSAPSSGAGGSLTATHTYSLPLQSNYMITVNTTDSLGLQGAISNSTALVPASQVPGAFSGQSTSFTRNMTSPPPSPTEQVTFECTTVTDSSGNVQDASAIGISCGSTPAPVTLSSVPTSVTINIQTNGLAAANANSLDRRAWLYAVCLPLPGLFFWCFGLGKRLSRRRALIRYGAQVLVAGLLLQLVGCGGGFTLPAATPPSSTPAGNYQITIVDNPVNSNTSGFIQISLIVPLTVSPTQ
ncbi:hypothetical protein [Acidobacterium sp. S8]|uniref:Ig-like domain-containing protein n=1 Tax=Acidobacterium sp. S8 TaxID=1641854 RepID=UPI00131E0355|nr:hypothetical protein [Acidobacterium sp. S8]